MAPLTITNKSTSSYLVECQGGMLLVDPGWAGSLPQLRHGLERYGIPATDIRYVMATHLHPDHAGLAQEVKRDFGARLLIHEMQIPFLGELESFYRKKGGYLPIVVEDGDIVVEIGGGREPLASIGIQGEIVETPGHSADSISLALDSGLAFVGDLPSPALVGEDAFQAVRDSWERLLKLNVHTAYHAHAGSIRMKDVEALLP